MYSLTSSAVSDIAMPIIACLDGRAVMRGISPFAGRIGEEIFAPSFSLIEDGMTGGLLEVVLATTKGGCRVAGLL